MDNFVTLQSIDGKEVTSGIFLVGEPTPVVGTDRLRCLANVEGMLVVVELRIRFRDGEK